MRVMTVGLATAFVMALVLVTPIPALAALGLARNLRRSVQL